MAKKKPIAFIMRHGDTVLNDDNAFRGMLDPPLNDDGIVDAHKAGEFLKSQDIECIICSPLLRAVQTAEIVAAALGGRHITQCRELLPWQIAPLYGKDKDEFAEELDDYIDHPNKKPENGESLNSFVSRVDKYFHKQLQSKVPTLYVAHTSDIVALNDLINGEGNGRPESGEVVAPGGICEIREDDEDGYCIEPVFGATTDAEFGS